MCTKIFRFLSFNWISTLFALIASTFVFGGIFPLTALYYGFIIILAFISIVQGKKIIAFNLILLICLIAGLIFNNPPSFFRSWQRLGLFILLYIAVIPVFKSHWSDKAHIQLLRVLLIICIIIGIGSFIAYFLGINLMRRGGESGFAVDDAGKFGGLSCHSMILGPLAAISTCVLTYTTIYFAHKKKWQYLYASGAIISACSMMLSASRAAIIACVFSLAVLTIIYCYGNKAKLIKIIGSSIILLIISFPVYAPMLIMVIAKQEINNNMGSATASRAERWEHRLEEFKENPVLGMGFAAIDPKYTLEYSKIDGQVEGGSSWLVLLSQTGIIGCVAIALIIKKIIPRLYKLSTIEKEHHPTLLLILLSFFFIHFVAEGYIYAPGSFLCLLFWTVIGCSLSLVSKKDTTEINIWTIGLTKNDKYS